MKTPAQLQTIVYSNIWVAIGAVALYLVTTSLHPLSFQLDVAIFIFTGTIFIYNYHRLFPLKNKGSAHGTERLDWINSHRKNLFRLSVLCLLFAVSIFFIRFYHLTLFLRFGPFLLLSLLYVLPVWKSKGKWIRLRDIPYLKIFLVATVWAFVTVFFPFLADNPEWFPQTEHWFTIVHRFLFIFAITLPFDIRDLEIDLRQGVKTWASRIGVEKIHFFSSLLLLMAVSCGFIAWFKEYYSMGSAFGMFVSGIYCTWLIRQTRPESSEFFYTFWLDGTMLDLLFWVWFMNLLF